MTKFQSLRELAVELAELAIVDEEPYGTILHGEVIRKLLAILKHIESNFEDTDEVLKAIRVLDMSDEMTFNEALNANYEVEMLKYELRELQEQMDALQRRIAREQREADHKVKEETTFTKRRDEYFKNNPELVEVD